jgi:hypothetical protein
MRAQPADIGNGVLRAVALRLDAEAPPVERRPLAGADEPPPVDNRLLPRRTVIPGSGRNQKRVAHFEIGETAWHAGLSPLLVSREFYSLAISAGSSAAVPNGQFVASPLSLWATLDIGTRHEQICRPRPHWRRIDTGNGCRSCLGLPVITCFLGPESNDFNRLVVISFDPARQRAGGRSNRCGRANLTVARDNLYLNLAADLLQMQQTAIDDLNFRL